MKEFMRTLAYLSLILLTSIAVVLSLNACKTTRVVSDTNTKQHNDTTTHVVEKNEQETRGSSRQDSLIRVLEEKLQQYENHQSRLDTLRTDSSVLVVDSAGNIIRSEYWHNQTIKDWRRDTVLLYRDRFDSTKIISQYKDSLNLLRTELDRYRQVVKDNESSDVIREKEPTLYDKVKEWWKEIVIATIVSIGMAFAIKHYFNNN